MRKLSLFILAASATLGVSMAQADDAVDASAGTDAPEVQVLPPAPADDADQTADPVLLVEDLDLHPIDQVVDLPEESGDPAPEVNIYHQLNTGDGAIDDTAATDDTSVVDDTAVTDDTAATDDTGTKEEVPTDDSAATDDTGTTDEVPTDDTELNPIMYTTSGGTDVRPDGCMQCRTLTVESAGVEAPAPEVTADVLDGNATGVDVMDPVEAKKPRSN